jgi:hypothetical protein
MNIVRIAEALPFAQPFYGKSLNRNELMRFRLLLVDDGIVHPFIDCSPFTPQACGSPPSSRSCNSIVSVSANTILDEYEFCFSTGVGQPRRLG